MNTFINFQCSGDREEEIACRPDTISSNFPYDYDKWIKILFKPTSPAMCSVQQCFDKQD